MTDAQWRFGVLGSLRAERDGRPVDLPARAPRTVLALLLMHRGRPLSVDQLADGLWGDERPSSADSALHVHLSKVRAAVGELLIRDGGGYLLEPTRWELDADRFRELTTLTDRAEPSAVERLTEALGLWRGSPLEDLAPDGRLAEWAAALEAEHLRARIALFQARLEHGAGVELASEIDALLAENPFEEQLWSELMVALYRGGRQADALDTYQRARRRFATELGIDPGPSLQAVHERVLAQDPGLLGPGRAPAPQAPDDPRGAPRVVVPEPVTGLVGRDFALDELARICQRPRCRLLTLIGTGGVGKTRLAVEHARRWSGSFADGVAFVDLSAVTAVEGVRVEIARALAGAFDDARTVTAATVPAYLRARDVLLVLDNFEQVVEAGPSVSELLASCPGLAVIVTSRIPLRLRGEHLYDVAPLAVSAVGDPAAGPAVELFLQGAAQVNPHFVADAEARESVAAICRALDGLPLGIELTSARVRSLAVADIARQLPTPLNLGPIGPGDLPERQRTLEAAVRWSFDLLTEVGRRTFLGAAVFEAPFTSDAIAAVTQTDPGPGLQELREASLLRVDEATGRYRVMVLIRDFGRRRLRDLPAFERTARDAHLRYFSALYAGLVSDKTPGNLGPLARRFAPDHADLRAAVARAVTLADPDPLPPLLWGLEPIWIVGALAEAGTVTDQVLGSVTLGDLDEVRLLMATSLAMGYRPEGVAWTRRARMRATFHGRPWVAAAALNRLFAMALDREEYALALQYRDEIAAIPDDELNGPVRAGCGLSLAAAHYLEGDLAAAASEAQTALENARSGANRHTQAVILSVALQFQSALTAEIRLESLRELIDLAAEVLVPDNTVACLWLASRYAVAFDPAAAAELLGLAERIALGDSWPEDELRDETLDALGGPDRRDLAAAAPPHDQAEALAVAADWLARRPEGEIAARRLLQPPGYRLRTSVAA